LTLHSKSSLSLGPGFQFSLFFNGAAAPSGAGSAHYRGFTIALRHTTRVKTPLDERSARYRDLYLTTHNPDKRQTPMPLAVSSPPSQQANGRRPTPQIVRPLGSGFIPRVRYFITNWVGDTPSCVNTAVISETRKHLRLVPVTGNIMVYS
jgi:hypothetical protein